MQMSCERMAHDHGCQSAGEVLVAAGAEPGDKIIADRHRFAEEMIWIMAQAIMSMTKKVASG